MIKQEWEIWGLQGYYNNNGESHGRDNEIEAGIVQGFRGSY